MVVGGLHKWLHGSTSPILLFLLSVDTLTPPACALFLRHFLPPRSPLLLPRYAYVFVGTWGYEFRCASRMAVGLFEAKGVDITVNEYVLSNLFWLGSLLIATLTGE